MCVPRSAMPRSNDASIATTRRLFTHDHTLTVSNKSVRPDGAPTQSPQLDRSINLELSWAYAGYTNARNTRYTFVAVLGCSAPSHVKQIWTFTIHRRSALSRQTSRLHVMTAPVAPIPRCRAAYRESRNRTRHSAFRAFLTGPLSKLQFQHVSALNAAGTMPPVS